MRICSWLVACAIILAAFHAGQSIMACDGEWHRNGELPDWPNISFSESNYPDIEIPERKRPRRRKKQKPIKANKREKPNLVLEHDYIEDEGFLKGSTKP